MTNENFDDIEVHLIRSLQSTKRINIIGTREEKKITIVRTKQKKKWISHVYQ